MNRLNPWVLVGIVVAEVCLASWGGAAVIVFALALHAWTYICWIPAVALGGVMLASTMFSILPGVERAIRIYAGILAGFAIFSEMIVAGAMHYFEAMAPVNAPATAIDVNPAWGFVIGGLPSLTGGALIHITAMYFAQKRRETDERDAEAANLETARGVRALNAKEEDDARRGRDAARQAEEAAATRSRQAVAQDLRQAEKDSARLATVLAGIEQQNEAIDEARRETERLRSRERRQRDKATPQPTASQPPSQPASHDQATASQPSQESASRGERREWARRQIESGAFLSEQGRELTGADIDKHFGPPRTGAAILREVYAGFDGELRVIASGKVE